MRTIKKTPVAAVLLILGATSCSGESPGGVVGPPASDTVASSKAISYFEGSVDVVRGTIDIQVRSPVGTITSQSTLPYGQVTGDVYFHGCPLATSATYDNGTHVLSANVQAVNLMSGAVGGLNAVIDSVAPTGVLLNSGSGSGSPSGIIASYGLTAMNTASCASTQPWSFAAGSATSFTFSGHADGTAPGTTNTFQFTDTSAIDLAPNALASFFSTLAPASTDFFYYGVHDNSTGITVAYCMEHADFYVNTYLAHDQPGNSNVEINDSASWNKYSNKGSGWSASDTNQEQNYYGWSGWSTNSYAVLFDWAMGGGFYMGIFPGNTGFSQCSSGQEHLPGTPNGALSCNADPALVTITVGPTRSTTCGF